MVSINLDLNGPSSSNKNTSSRRRGLCNTTRIKFWWLAKKLEETLMTDEWLLGKTLVRAGAAGMAGTVLAVPLFGHLTISRCGLYSRGGVAPTWWCSIDVNVAHACSSKRPAAHVSLALSWNFLTS